MQQMLEEWPCDLALQAFRKAEIDECIRFTDGSNVPQATLLHARALLRLKRPEEALRVLARLPHMISRVQQAEEAVIQAIAYTQLGDVQQASNSAGDANIYAVSFEPLEAEAEIACSRFRFNIGDFESAYHRVHQALAIKKETRRLPGEPKAYTMPLTLIRGQAYDLGGMLEAYGGDYHAQFDALKKAIPLTRQDLYEEMRVLEHLASVTCDLDVAEEVPALLKLAHALKWTTATSHEHVFTVESLGWCMALHGDFASAEREFQDAFMFSRDPEMRLSTLLYRAQLARETDRESSVCDLLSYAEDLASHVCWEHVGEEEQSALLLLAEELAPSSPTHAQAALEQYRHLNETQHPIHAIEPKMKAWETYVDGLIARANGHHDRACALQMSALDAWRQIDFDWHTTLAALELCELGLTEQFAPYVKNEAMKRPNSWLALRAHRVLEAA